MAFQAITTLSLPLPRWQSNSPVFGVPSFVRLHEYKPQKTWWCLRSISKKRSSGYGAEDIKNLKWDTDDSKEESGSAVIASEDYKKTQNGKPLEEDGSVETMMKLLLVEAAVQRDRIAAQERMIVDLQKRVAPSSELTAAQEQMTVDFQRTVSPSSELTDAKDQKILDLQKRVEMLELNAAQQQMIADLQRKIAQLESDAEFKSKTKTPPTEIHAKSKSKTETPPAKIHVQSESKTKTPPAENHVIGNAETVEQRQKTSLVYFPPSSDKEEPTGVNDDYAMAAMNALQKSQLDRNAGSKSKTKTPPTKNHASGDSETDEKHQRTSLVYFPASSDEEEPTGVNDDYTTAAMNGLQRMQLDLNAKSKSKTKTPPTENRVSGNGKTDEQRQRKSLVYFPASSDEVEPTGVNDDYTMAAMKALQRKQLDLNAESKSKAKTPPKENRVSGNGKTDEKHQRTSLVYFPASSDEEEPTGVNDDYTTAAMNGLQRMQLDLNAKSKSKTKTPPTENRVSGNGKTDEQRQRKSLVYFPASSDEVEPTGVNDDYTMAAMKALQRKQLDLNAESKSKAKTPPKENRVSGNGKTDKQRQRTSLVYFPASTDEEEPTGVDDDYAMAAMKALQRNQLDLNAELKSKTKTPPTENRVSGNGKTEEQRQRTSLLYFPASSDEKEPTGVNDDYTMAAMKALQRKQLDLNAESKSKMKTPPTENRVSGNGKTDEQRQRTSLVYFPAPSDEEEPTEVNDEYTMAAMKALQRKQLDLNAESKSKTKTPPAENRVSGNGKTDEQRLRTSLVYFPASSDEKEPTVVNDDYTMAAMKALQRKQLDLNAESKSKMKTPPTENRVSGNGKTDEQRQRTSLVYFPASSDEEEPTGVNDDYTMAAMKALQRKQLDLNAESKSKTKTPPAENRVSGNGKTDEQRQRTSLLYFPASSDEEEPTSLKTPQTESRIQSDDETDEEELSSDEEEFSSDEDEQCEKSPLVNFSASSDGEEKSRLKDDNYTMAVMNVLKRTQMERNAKSKSKMETPLETPQTEIQLSGGETNEEEHSSGYKDDEYTTAIMNQISKPHKMRFSRKDRKNVINEVHLQD